MPLSRPGNLVQQFTVNASLQAMNALRLEAITRCSPGMQTIPRHRPPLWEEAFTSGTLLTV